MELPKSYATGALSLLETLQNSGCDSWFPLLLFWRPPLPHWALTTLLELNQCLLNVQWQTTGQRRLLYYQSTSCQENPLGMLDFKPDLWWSVCIKLNGQWPCPSTESLILLAPMHSCFWPWKIQLTPLLLATPWAHFWIHPQSLRDRKLLRLGVCSWLCHYLNPKISV